MKWWNNGTISRRSEVSPGEEFSTGRLYFERSSPTKETRQKMSVALKGRDAWNKGLATGPESEETKLRKSIAAKKRDNFNYKGRTPWNKGKSASDDLRILSYTTKQMGQKRTGNYDTSQTRWKDKGNPWYGKDRSKDKSPRYKGEYHKREYRDYRNRVSWLTENTYVKNMKTINPNNYPRTLSGVKGGYQLDHILSVAKGFFDKISPNAIAKAENLQMLPWIENVRKGSK